MVSFDYFNLYRVIFYHFSPYLFSAIRLINTNFKVERAIIAVIKHEPIHMLKGVDAILPTGLVRDNRTRSVFFNGQAGHLQLFNLDTNSIIFNVRILLG